MTENEAFNMLKAKLKCTELEDLACIEKGCDRKCDNCDLNYEQGNHGQQKEAMSVAIKALEEIWQYRAIGTVEKCREAMERQRAKKSIRIDMCTCPKCGTHNEIIKKRRNTVPSDIVYCWHCGQAIEVKRSDTY